MGDFVETCKQAWAERKIERERLEQERKEEEARIVGLSFRRKFSVAPDRMSYDNGWLVSVGELEFRAHPDSESRQNVLFSLVRRCYYCNREVLFAVNDAAGIGQWIEEGKDCCSLCP